MKENKTFPPIRGLPWFLPTLRAAHSPSSPYLARQRIRRFPSRSTASPQQQQQADLRNGSKNFFVSVPIINISRRGHVTSITLSHPRFFGDGFPGRADHGPTVRGPRRDGPRTAARRLRTHVRPPCEEEETRHLLSLLLASSALSLSLFLIFFTSFQQPFFTHGNRFVPAHGSSRHRGRSPIWRVAAVPSTFKMELLETSNKKTPDDPSTFASMLFSSVVV
ncbi:hypothetical protein BV898_14365 [Hypsibius exemplaris]|uniref:Uncharacterized protein n=1 Tax=Hypsibius exemplaris TaxID=2072580 RepID=A0A9X6N9Q2_HYPEX|nr:hypothetical protein BV898_14365 [Hypsibius exemplaris]